MALLSHFPTQRSAEMQIAAAGNVEVPAYLVLIAKGYDVSHSGADGDRWWARKHDDSFSAESPLMLLGLVTMSESRGSNWQATDTEIHAFLETFPGVGQR